MGSHGQIYRLKLPPTYKIHDVFHVALLEPWVEREGVVSELPASAKRNAKLSLSEITGIQEEAVNTSYGGKDTYLQKIRESPVIMS